MRRIEQLARWPVRFALAALLLGAGAAVVWWIGPGGLGNPDPVQVTGGLSASLYREVTDAAAGAPPDQHLVVDLATKAALVCLGILLCWTGWTGLRRGDARRISGAVLVGAATVAAYATSEALKLVVDEERPCRALGGLGRLGECPAPGDWSFPSNHTVLAAALAVGLSVVWPRITGLAVPLAALVGLLRVAAGVHYPHDVLAGVILGGVAAAAVLLVAWLPAAGLTAKADPWLRRLRVSRPTSPRGWAERWSNGVEERASTGVVRAHPGGR